VNLLDNGPLRAYAIASTVLAIHLLVLAVWTGMVRMRRKQWINPEDARFLPGENVAADHPDVARVRRAHANALENAIPFFVVAAIYVVKGASSSGAVIYFGTFVAARLLHTAFYLLSLQPLRTLSFAVGVAAIVGMAVSIVRAVL
jgi:microsomal prostaglandin-E synthase 1